MNKEIKSPADLDALIDAIGDSRIVMLGEASHGTHEYYVWRTEISKRLIAEKGFSCIAVEGDWPDCHRINNYVKNTGNKAESITDILKTFNRWPTWMWANWEVAALAEWLKDYNLKACRSNKVGFYGLDVYSLWESMDVMMEYLSKEDPQTAETLKETILCFEPYDQEGQLYAHASGSKFASCKEKVLKLLKEVRSNAINYDGEPEAALNVEQNARIAVNAERYYSAMLGFGSESWNIRDTHMAQTIHYLLKFHGPKSKIIVWAHNTHIGDARATDMKRYGMHNIGQLAREQYGDDQVFLVGFGSYQGTVIAGSGWGAAMQVMTVPEARKGSFEELMHDLNPVDQLLLFNHTSYENMMDHPLPHRAIGVVYDTAGDRTSNYVDSLMKARYDAFIYIDETTALHPFIVKANTFEMPETYPYGM